MLGAGGGIDRLNRLALRLVILLSLALLPIGLIAVLQTYRMLEDARERAENAILAQTSLAANFERQLIQTAIGAAQAFGAAIPRGAADREVCNELFRRFTASSDRFDFAGFVDPSGKLLCGSDHAYIDIAKTPMFTEMRTTPQITARPDQIAAEGGAAVVLVGVPVFDQGAFTGAVTIAIPHSALDARVPARGEVRPLELVTFNKSGEVLTAARGLPGAAARLPGAFDLRELSDGRSESFNGATVAGAARVFSVVPVIEETVFALASWAPETAPAQSRFLSVPTAAFPVLMWLASLSVAFYAMHRLVVRPIRRLRHRIRVFSSTRRTLEDPDPDAMPAELREVSDAFQAMTRRILEDEAMVEKSLLEKNVLLKEVHHRVKNNLQLITSILNLQMRRCRSEETRQILRRLQNRVLGLAAIHQTLYHASSLSKVRADELVREIVSQMSSGGLSSEGRIKVTRHFDPITLYPDQAVPLALLANEAVTNARKYLGAEPGQTPWIDIRLSASPDGQVELTVRNSLGDGRPERPELPSEGLGTELIDAFAIQLGTQAIRDDDGETFTLGVHFQVAEFEDTTAPVAAAV